MVNCFVLREDPLSFPKPHTILDRSKLKASADEKINANEVLKIGFGRVENIVEKEKMLVTSIFSFSHNVF